MESPSVSPMAWLLERARTTPASAGSFASQHASELQIWASVDDNQRAVEAERPDAPHYVQKYLAERRTYIDFWGSDELHLFPALTSVASSPSKAPMTTGMRFTSSAPGVGPVHNPSIHGRALRATPSFSRDGNASRPRSRSRQHDESYYRSDLGHRSRSVSPRSESRRDYGLEPLSRIHDMYSSRESRSRYRSLSPTASRHRDPSRSPPPREIRPTEQPASWQRLAERVSNKDPDTLRGHATVRRFTIPSSEIRHSLQDAFIARPKPHINTRTGKPYPPLQFRDPKASRMILGKREYALEEISKFFPAVVFQVEKVVENPDTMSPKICVNLWLEVKPSSDPLNDGVKWQVDACRRGFEAYQKRDKDGDGLPEVRDYYYANRRLFHHSMTKQGLYLQALGRPRNHKDLLAQASNKAGRMTIASPDVGGMGRRNGYGSPGNRRDIQSVIKRER
ncbi:hypothetical protein IFR05_011050 [Cadophora sp. M221]|nr:hypothetical protein IFR05_011050 [Cadophora sp. M221]